jgi:hypothetical protein
MDQLDQIGAKAFACFLVRRDLVRNYVSRDNPLGRRPSSLSADTKSWFR